MNHNFRARVPAGDYFIRIGKATQAESANTKIASKLGLAPSIIYENADIGILVLPFLNEQIGAFNWENHDLVTQVVADIRRLHQAEEVFPQAFSPYDAINTYIKASKKVPPTA